MVISPPFLPPRGNTEAEVSWFERAMKACVDKACGVDTEAGSFPVSGQFMWHTGVHMVAPFDANAALPVRAMADGKVVYVSPPTAYTKEVDHPQNYTALVGALWSDNGCVILRHDTEIGAAGDTPTIFSFYTLTMHLQTIEPAIKLGAQVYRKDVLGKPGRIYGAQNTIHVEVCCNATQLEKLTGRVPRWADLEFSPVPIANGRTDVVYGDLLIYLPVTTAVVREERLLSALPRRLDAGTHTELRVAQWVSIRHKKGDAIINSVDMTGKIIGTETGVGQGFEYKLYENACAKHTAYVHGAGLMNASSPSGWYELLRFGRNLGTDPLPGNAAHWREIPTATGTIWADLNSVGTFKFSEADFLAVTGWNFFDDDTDHLDQRCQSVQLKRRIRNPNQYAEGRDTQEHLNERLGNSEVREKLRRSICYFPTEWDRATIHARYKWMQEADKKSTPNAKFQAHCEAMTFADLPEEYKNAMWRFHPVEFVQTMRKVGWLSLGEFKQLVPQNTVRGKGAGLDGPFFYERSEANAGILLENHSIELNRTARKYCINTPPRMAGFFSNSIQETDWWTVLYERGGEKLRYAPWYGRGFLQLTNPDGQFTSTSNYGKYFYFRGYNTVNISAAELSHLQTNLTKSKNDACESAGAYWAWMHANKFADVQTQNTYRAITLDHTSQLLKGGTLTIYENISFRKIACAINLPAAVERADPRMNGLADRYSAYAVAQLVLMDTAGFPDAKGSVSFTTPTFNSRERS